MAAGAFLFGLRRLGLARRGVLAREPRPLVSELAALNAQPRGLEQGAGQHRSAVAALQLANLEVKCGNLLVELSDHLRAGIDLIRGGHGHAALGIGGRGGGGHGHAAALGQRAPVPALGATALSLLDAAALSKDVLELNADGSAAVLWSRLEFDRGGGDDGTKPRTERGFSREVLRLPPAAALGPGGSLDEFWTRAAQHCGVVEVEIDGKLVYPF